MPPKNPSEAKSSSKKTEDAKQENLKKMIKSIHTHMIKMESKICELMVDEEKKGVYIDMLKKRDEFKQAKNSAIMQWKKYQESISTDTYEEFPSFDKYMEMHDQIWEEFNNAYPPRKKRTEEQDQKRSKRMKAQWEKLELAQVRQKELAQARQEELDDKTKNAAEYGKNMGADINLMSKMPSYLRSFKH